MPHLNAFLVIAGLGCLSQPSRGPDSTRPLDNPPILNKGSQPPGAVWTIAFTPDNKVLLSGGADGRIRFWDVASGQLIRSVLGHRADVWSLVVAPDGKLVASGGEDGSVALWEMPSGQLRRRLDTKQGLIRAVAFSPDGQTIASGGLDNAVCLWDVPSGKLLRRLEGHRERVTCLSFAPDGELLASGSWDNTVRLWHPAGGQEVRRLESGLKVLIALSFTPDSKALVASSFDANPLLMWDAGTGRPIRKIGLHQHTQTFATLSPDGRSIAAATTMNGNAIHIWDSTTAAERRRVVGLPAAVQCIAFSPNGRRLAAGDKAGGICLWDAETGLEQPFAGRPADHGNFATIWLAHVGPVTALAFAPDGQTCASAGTSGDILLWSDSPPRAIRRLSVSDAVISRLSFSADGKTLAAACSDNSVRLYEAADGKELRRLRGNGEPAIDVCFSADGKLVLAVGLDFTLRVWLAKTGQCTQQFDAAVPRLPLPPGLVQSPQPGRMSVTLSPDGQTVAFTDSAGRLHFHDLATGLARRAPIDVGDLPTCLWYAPTGRTLAVGKQGALEIWEIASRGRRQALTGMTGAVSMVQFSADGRRVAAATTDRRAYLWDLATGRQALQFLGETSPIEHLQVSQVHFLPDGQAVAVGSADEVVFRNRFADLLAGAPSNSIHAPGDNPENLWRGFLAEEAWGLDRAIWQLAATPDRAIPFLLERLRRLEGPRVNEIPRLIRDLDDNRFAIRSKATEELELLGELAEPALRQTLANKPSLEVVRRIEPLLARLEQAILPSRWLRVLRALEVLEQIGSGQSRQALEALKNEAASAWIRQEA
ncbi:MAG TPA: WD40 repeat domain-containing protein, partial [Gemmataceae bacterium]|nr:WD40 repeat domain-containing protein [Gemmataceae bacterium]